MIKKGFLWVITVIGLITVSIGAIFLWANHLENPLSPDMRADLVVVEKSRRRLTLYFKGEPLKTYKISLGRVPVGPKEREGDNKTPEGRYTIDFRNPKSLYYLALHISYPNQKDIQAAREKGVSPGGDIMIHGLPNRFGRLGKLHRLVDLSRGCIVVTNKEMDELWRAIPNGTPIDIEP
ncbi:MAG: L,D-transpeptidase family protein [Acidobacteriota bacterium]|nr:L,D-transpeptidase family protein [Acidobacteriota bacterium]